MARDVSDATPIGARDELVAWIAAGEKPRDDWRLGTEHEKIPFYKAGHAPVPYEGEAGIRALLDGLRAETGWEPILDHNNIIGLFDANGGGAISLEPGGQFELSGAPVATIHETAEEFARHMDEVKRVAGPMDMGFLTLGMSPKWSQAETPVMPKDRKSVV